MDSRCDRRNSKKIKKICHWSETRAYIHSVKLVAPNPIARPAVGFRASMDSRFERDNLLWLNFLSLPCFSHLAFLGRSPYGAHGRRSVWTASLRNSCSSFFSDMFAESPHISSKERNFGFASYISQTWRSFQPTSFCISAIRGGGRVRGNRGPNPSVSNRKDAL